MRRHLPVVDQPAPSRHPPCHHLVIARPDHGTRRQERTHTQHLHYASEARGLSTHPATVRSGVVTWGGRPYAFEHEHALNCRVF